MKASVAQLVQNSAAVYALGGAAVALWGAIADSAGIIQAGALMAIGGMAVYALTLALTPRRRR